MKKIFAEFLGTFTLVLVACGTASALSCITSSPDTSYLMTALTFGLVVMALAYIFSDVSGCHINPAVSLAVLLTGGMSVLEFIGYVVAQIAGAVTGASVLWMLFGSNVNLGQNYMYQENPLKSIVVEAILTAVFVLVILCVTSKRKYNKISGLIIGLTLTLVHIFGIHFTGTSVNPARSIGPAVLAGGQALADLWVFIVAPLIGAVIAVVIYKLIVQGEGDDEYEYYDDEYYEDEDEDNEDDEDGEKNNADDDKPYKNSKLRELDLDFDLDAEV